MSSVKKEETLQIEVPASVKRQLSVKAAREGATIRSLVLKALREYGIKVSETELVDRRRKR